VQETITACNLIVIRLGLLLSACRPQHHGSTPKGAMSLPRFHRTRKYENKRM